VNTFIKQAYDHGVQLALLEAGIAKTAVFGTESLQDRIDFTRLPRYSAGDLKAESWVTPELLASMDWGTNPEEVADHVHTSAFQRGLSGLNPGPDGLSPEEEDRLERDAVMTTMDLQERAMGPFHPLEAQRRIMGRDVFAERAKGLSHVDVYRMLAAEREARLNSARARY